MRNIILLISFFSLFLFGCENGPHQSYIYHPPEQNADGLNVGSLKEVNMDSTLLEKVVDSINLGKYTEVHAILIFKDDKLVFEEYFNGHTFKFDTTRHHGKWVAWDKDSLHSVMSVTKSITSACVGIAIDKGFIENVDQSIFEYFPEYQHLKEDGKEKITIEHLLTMTSGLQGNEWLIPYSNLKNDIVATYLAEDPIGFILSKPVVYEPGTNFQYFGGSNLLLGEIVKNAAKMNLNEFGTRYLFTPLGIAPHYWYQLPNGVVDGAGGLRITPRDMVKIGATFLNNGIWNGKRIIFEQWVDNSGTPFPGNNWTNNWDDHWGLRGYGYSWWTHQFSLSGKRIQMYYAGGWGGQYIMVIPDLKTVVVFTGANYTSPRPSFEIFKKYIVRAIG